MIISSFFLSLLFYYVQAEGEFIIVRSPPSIKFSGDEPIDQTLIPDICSAALGFTTSRESDWKGMQIIDPFNFAEAVIVLYVDGIPSLGSRSDFQKYYLDSSREEEYTWNAIKNEIVKRFPAENNTLLRVELGYGSKNENLIKNSNFNNEVQEDASFLNELNDLQSYSYDVQKGNGIPDLYWYVLKGLHTLSDVRGPHDPSTLEAKQKVNDELARLGEIFAKAYDGKVLVAAIVSDASHTRRTRNAQEGGPVSPSAAPTSPPVKGDGDLNVTPKADENFPAIFNIILWFSVINILSLIAICYFIGNMDPGRDSIIYRMTSNRMKKDS